MGKCSSCGKKGFFLKLDNQGNCKECADLRIKQLEEKRKEEEKKIEAQRLRRELAIWHLDMVKKKYNKGESIPRKEFEKLYKDCKDYGTDFFDWWPTSQLSIKESTHRKGRTPDIGSMSIDKIAELLCDDVLHNTGFMEQLDEYNNRQEAKLQNKGRRVNKIDEIHERAHKKEREGDLEGALKLYLENLKKHPDGTVYFDRPCIVLEKLGRYEEAIILCNQALERIDMNAMRCDPASYNRRKERLRKKIEKRDN